MYYDYGLSPDRGTYKEKEGTFCWIRTRRGRSKCIGNTRLQ